MAAFAFFFLNQRAVIGGGLADGQVLVDEAPVYISDAPCVVT